MTLQVRLYDSAQAEQWDTFCSSSHQATFLHTRKFLAYHGQRFMDRSLVIEQNQRLVGLFPAAEHPQDNNIVVSHPGITYGGIIQNGGLTGAHMVDALQQAVSIYHKLGYHKLIYKAVPIIYHRAPAQDDLYALFRLNAARIRCDLSSAIDLYHRLSVSDRRKRSLKKAHKASITIKDNTMCLPDLWTVLEENLARKHEAKPVHSLEEILRLTAWFPDNIRCICALKDNLVVAGVLLFITPTAYHAQYIASNLAGYETSALDMVFEYCLDLTKAAGVRWFDFGISNEQGGKILNEGLYQFKTEFGGGGVVHEFYEIAL